jgi:hypothetical protein
VTEPRLAGPARGQPSPGPPAQCDATPLPGGTRPLRAAEVTAIGAGRRLYRTEVIGPDATVNTILCHARALQPLEEQALQQIGERSFGICARAGVHYQQAADLLAELRER